MTPCIAASQSHNHAACVLREMAGTEHQILDHCPQSPAANLPLRWLLVFEGFLANHSQQIEGDHRQFQNKRIGSKLSRGKPFHIYVCLQFTVVLFAFSVRMVGSNDVIIGPSKVGPEHVQFNIRDHEDLAVFVNGTLNDFVDDPHAHRLRFPGTVLVGDILPGCSYINILSGTGMADILTAALQLVQSSFFGLLAWIPLDDEPGTILYQDSQILSSIIAGIHPDQ